MEIKIYEVANVDIMHNGNQLEIDVFPVQDEDDFVEGDKFVKLADLKKLLDSYDREALNNFELPIGYWIQAQKYIKKELGLL